MKMSSFGSQKLIYLIKSNETKVRFFTYWRFEFIIWINNVSIFLLLS